MRIHRHFRQATAIDDEVRRPSTTPYPQKPRKRNFFGPSRQLALLVACAFFVIVTLVVPASGQQITQDPSPESKPKAPSNSLEEGYFAPYPGPVPFSGSRLAMAESGVITAGSCRYRQVIDDPHLSGRAVSVHGSWKRVSGTCPAEANVDTYLQAYWCDWYAGCRWVTVASNSDDIRAGTGRGKRVTARKACTASPPVGWRGYVDVDLKGVSDPRGYTYSRIMNLPCMPT